MRTFLSFCSEARTSRISDQAERAGLTGDGHGNWYDKQGNIVAKTEKGKLSYLSKGQPAQQQQEPQPKTQQAPPEQQTEFGAFGDGTPRRMSPPTRADGSPKEDLGPLTVTFGRFNPPTIGHQKLLDKAKAAAGDGTLRVYPSRSQDAKKNPLDPEEKAELMKRMFPDHAGSIVSDPNARTIFDVLKQAHQDGYSSVKIVVGGDRVKEFEKMSGDYNGKLYDFSGVETVSAGERDEDAEGVEGMSASKMRKAAAEDDFKTFASGLPSNIDDKTAKLMMTTIRKRMKVAEGYELWEIAPKFDWKNLRENFVTGAIFKMGQLVENLNTGLVGKVIRRGTNYLICVTEDNVMFKSWIRDLSEATVNYPGPSGIPSHQREVGTDSLRDYVMRMTGVINGRKFINKYKKKKVAS